MKIRLLADADLKEAIVNGVIRLEPIVDFLSARDAGVRAMVIQRFSCLQPQSREYWFHIILVSHDVATCLLIPRLQRC